MDYPGVVSSCPVSGHPSLTHSFCYSATALVGNLERPVSRSLRFASIGPPRHTMESAPPSSKKAPYKRRVTDKRRDQNRAAQKIYRPFILLT